MLEQLSKHFKLSNKNLKGKVLLIDPGRYRSHQSLETDDDNINKVTTDYAMGWCYEQVGRG